MGLLKHGVALLLLCGLGIIASFVVTNTEEYGSIGQLKSSAVTQIKKEKGKRMKKQRKMACEEYEKIIS